MLTVDLERPPRPQIHTSRWGVRSTILQSTPLLPHRHAKQQQGLHGRQHSLALRASRHCITLRIAREAQLDLRIELYCYDTNSEFAWLCGARVG